jgi:hypothetical protein
MHTTHARGRGDKRIRATNLSCSDFVCELFVSLLRILHEERHGIFPTAAPWVSDSIRAPVDHESVHDFDAVDTDAPTIPDVELLKECEIGKDEGRANRRLQS